MCFVRPETVYIIMISDMLIFIQLATVRKHTMTKLIIPVQGQQQSF